MMPIANVLADWHDHMMDGGGAGWWVWGVLMMVLMLGIVALVVWLIVRSSHGSGGLPSSSAREILSERFARGEIDADEYHDRLSKLR
jgi:putative membrane protein